MKVGLVLLASGFARRYGENKLLVPVEGVPLYRRAFAALPPGLFARAAVTSQYPEILKAARAEGYLALENQRAQEGISAGIRLGLAAMNGLDGVLFAVCDQPYLTQMSTKKLLAAFEASQEQILALSWQGKRGNPVLFPEKYFPRLSALTGDQGGSALLRDPGATLTKIEAASPRELEDLDIPITAPQSP